MPVKGFYVRKMLFVTILLVLAPLVSDCGNHNGTYRQLMRDFVQEISAYAKETQPGFIIIPQNGQELLTENGEEDGDPVAEYLDAIDGVGREDLYYGYNDDNVQTPVNETNYMTAFLDIAESSGVQVLVTDYCSDTTFVGNSYTWNEEKFYISFAADHRDLDNIPDYPAAPYNENPGSDITSLADAKNFLYIINPESYATKDDFLLTIKATNYDIVLIDLFDNDNNELIQADVTPLKDKSGGGSRLVIAYMSIGEAEDYRYYWQSAWKTNPPSWLAGENPDWPGNYKVRYWDENWRAIIYGNDASYLKKIIDAGFDGVYLDIIDAFEYFE